MERKSYSKKTGGGACVAVFILALFISGCGMDDEGDSSDSDPPLADGECLSGFHPEDVRQKCFPDDDTESSVAIVYVNSSSKVAYMGSGATRFILGVGAGGGTSGGSYKVIGKSDIVNFWAGVRQLVKRTNDLTMLQSTNHPPKIVNKVLAAVNCELKWDDSTVKVVYYGGNIMECVFAGQ